MKHKPRSFACIVYGKRRL